MKHQHLVMIDPGASLDWEPQFYPRIARLAAELCVAGPGAIDSMAERPGHPSLLGWFNATPHTDDSGLIYIMPLIACGTVLHVSKSQMELRTGAVYMFSDYLRHWTRDKASCIAILFPQSLKREGPQDAIAAMHAYEKQLKAEAKA